MRNSFRRRSSQPDLCDLELSCNRAVFPCQDPVEVEKLINDLKAAVEVNSSKGRSVLYPGKSMKFDDLPLAVSLRDDPSIHAICKEFAGTQLCMSSGAFGNFGTEVQHFIEQEDVSIQREQRLKEQRGRELLKPGVLGDFRAFCEIELLPLVRNAGVPGDLPRCSARKLRRSSCALPRSRLPLLLHEPNHFGLGRVLRGEG